MKIKTIVMAMGLALTSHMAAATNQADQGHGTIHFHGTIIDAPCSLDYDNANQTVQLGNISDSMLQGGGESESKPFEINLINCSATTKENVTTTWSGAKDPELENALGITGNASGAGIMLKAGDGTPVTLGQPTPKQKLGNGNVIMMSAYLKGHEGSSSTIVPGTFDGAADFIVSYE